MSITIKSAKAINACATKAGLTLALAFIAFAANGTLAQGPEKSEIRPFVCTNASLYGQYAVIGHGTAPAGPPPTPAGPFATVSLMTIDGLGALTNKVTRSIAGNISRGTDTGSYTINSDCTGTMTLVTPTAPFPLTFDVVISDIRGIEWADEFYFIATSPGGTIAASAKRLR